jgi:hypothetical protein
MHPEILRELSSQRGREMRDRAHQFAIGRIASRARQAQRRGVAETDEFVVPAVPDYVDGSFRLQSADDEAARVPTTGRAA